MSKHMFYPKIDTLFNRGENFKVIPGEYRQEEFEYINKWLVTEKLDGTNLSLIYTNSYFGNFRGRTENAQFNDKQRTFLSNLVQDRIIRGCRIANDYNLESLEIFGEFFGAGIQNGGKYGDMQFRVYDMRVDEKTWLDHESVLSNCERLGLEHVPYWPDLVTTDDIVGLVENGFQSLVPNSMIDSEGVVLKTPKPLYDQRGKRIIAKTKHRDF